MGNITPLPSSPAGELLARPCRGASPLGRLERVGRGSADQLLSFLAFGLLYRQLGTQRSIQRPLYSPGASSCVAHTCRHRFEQNSLAVSARVETVPITKKIVTATRKARPMFSPNTTGQIAKIPANNVAGYQANDKRDSADLDVPHFSARLACRSL